MTVLLLFILAAAATQTDALFTGVVPAEAPTFEVTMTGARQPFYAALRLEGQWVLDHRMEIRPEQVIELVPDIPYYTGEITRTMMRNATLVYEAPAMRRKRLHDLWTSMGYTFLETKSGWQAVKEEDIQLAKRAQEMADNSIFTPSSQALAAATASSQHPVSNENSLSPAKLWSMRIGIILLGLLALAATYILARKKGDSWNRV